MQILSQKQPPLEGALEVQLEWYMPDNRKCDLTNKSESIMDLLVDCFVIIDDSWQIVKTIIMNCNGVDKKDPRCEIWIVSLI